MLPASPDAAPSAGPVGAQQRPPGRREKPALQRPWPFLRALAKMGWSCLLPGFPKPAKDRPRGISHLCGCSSTRPSVSPPSRPRSGGLAAPGGSVHPCAPRTPLHSLSAQAHHVSPPPQIPSATSDSAHSVPDSGLAAGISCCPLHVPPMGPEQRGHRLLPGAVGGGHFMAWSDSLPCHPFPCEQHRVTSKCGGGTTS